MPHVLVSVVAGHPLAARLAIREVPANDWMAAVYEPEIVAHEDLLFERPGYGPLAPQS